jgi:hypothetical protein
MILSALTVPAGATALATLWLVHVLYVLYKIGVHRTPIKQLVGHLAILFVSVVVSIYIFMAQAHSSFTDPQATGPDGLPMIFWTLKRDNEKEVRAIIVAGADVNASGYHGATPTIAAARLEQWHYVNLLLENGAKLDVVDGLGFNVPYMVLNSEIDSTSSEYQNLGSARQKIAEAGLSHWSLYKPSSRTTNGCGWRVAAVDEQYRSCRRHRCTIGKSVLVFASERLFSYKKHGRTLRVVVFF